MNIRTFVAKSHTFVAKSAIWFSKNEGGIKGRLEFFRKFIRFGRAARPLVRCHMLLKFTCTAVVFIEVSNPCSSVTTSNGPKFPYCK